MNIPPELEKYLKTLSPDLQDLYRRCYDEFNGNDDDSSEEFQVVAAMLDVFDTRAREGCVGAAHVMKIYAEIDKAERDKKTENDQ